MLAADVFDAFKEAGLDNETEQAVIGKRSLFLFYHIKLKYSETISSYHTYPKILTGPF